MRRVVFRFGPWDKEYAWLNSQSGLTGTVWTCHHFILTCIRLLSHLEQQQAVILTQQTVLYIAMSVDILTAAVSWIKPLNVNQPLVCCSVSDL